MDLIDRQAAIDVLNKHSVLFEFHLPHEFHEVKEEIRGLPSAEPKIGHWMWSVDEYGESWFCSECLSEYVAEEGIPTWAHYCPNCGARMEGEDNEID